MKRVTLIIIFSIIILALVTVVSYQVGVISAQKEALRVASIPDEDKTTLPKVIETKYVVKYVKDHVDGTADGQATSSPMVGVGKTHSAQPDNVTGGSPATHTKKLNPYIQDQTGLIKEFNELMDGGKVKSKAALMAKLKSPTEGVDAAMYLSALKDASPEIPAMIKEASDNPELSVPLKAQMKQAAVTAAAHQEDWTSATKWIDECLDAPEAMIRHFAVLGAHQLPKEHAIPLLLKALNDGDPNTAKSAHMVLVGQMFGGRADFGNDVDKWKEYWEKGEPKEMQLNYKPTDPSKKNP